MEKKHARQLDPNTQIAIMLISGLSLIVALAWNTAITTYIDEVFGTVTSKGLFGYAIGISLFAILVIYNVSRYVDTLISVEDEEAEVISEVVG